MRLVACSVLAVSLTLAACDGTKENAGGERKTAAGEVLGGSISDAMLPLATVQSQSPPLRESASDDAGGEDTAGTREGGNKETEAPSVSASARASSSATGSPAVEASATPAPAATE